MNLTALTRPYFNRIYRAETAAAERLEQSQRSLLNNLIHTAKATHFGRRHSFVGMGGYADFASEVPPASYSDLREMIMRMVDGEADVLWAGRVRRFAQSSGTSDGKSKFIPISPRNLARGHYAGAAFSLASYLHFYPDSRVFDGKNLILGGSFENELNLRDKRVKVGDLSATLIDRINPLVNLVRVPSKRVALMADWARKLPAIVEASVGHDVRSLSGVPSWFLTVLKDVMARTGASSLFEVWPNLEVFFHGGIAFGPYRESYAHLTAPRTMRYWENYNASEGFFGVQSTPGNTVMRLLMNADVFYEFVPVGTPDATPIPLWEVSQGGVYEMIITSSNGLWRYRIGDTVRIENVSPPEITIVGRTAHFINAFGEEVMVHNADAAITEASRASGTHVLNYTVAPVYAGDNSRGRHQWVVEFDGRIPDPHRFAALLDEALQRVNSDYQAKRQGGIFLDEPEVVVARDGLFDRWLASTGKLGGQRKVPRLANDRRFIEPLLKLNQEMQ